MIMNKAMSDRIGREIEQCWARLQFLEKHHRGIGREAALLRRRLTMLKAIQASGIEIGS
jgi:hypothetical protein